MIEALAAGALLGLVTLAALAGPGTLLRLGLAAALLGLLASSGAGLVYHLRLAEALRRLGTLPPRWWWAPTRLHHRLDPEGRRRALPWFYAGGTAIGLCVVGLCLVLCATVKAHLAF